MLLYTRELVAPRPGRGQGLLRFKQRPPTNKCLERLRQSLKHSTIHGMLYVFEERHLWQKSLWLAIVLGATIGGLSMYSVLRARLDEQVLVSLIETTQQPVYHIEFPAVAVCPWSHVNWDRAESAIKRFLPRNPDEDLRESFRQLLHVLELTSFENFKSASVLSKRNLTELGSMSMMKLINYLAYRCDELFVKDSCEFDETSYDCCKLFVPEQTEKGQCLVFNSLISEHSQKKQLTNKFYPYRLSTAGEESGLKFTLNVSYAFVREGTHIPFGMNLMIKQPRQWSNKMMYHLYPHTENFVAVHPRVVETSTNTLFMSPIKRRCYFDSEKNPLYRNTSLPYNRENCLAVCLHHVVLNTCNCSAPVFLPPIGGTRECAVTDGQCLAANSDIFSYSKTRDQDKYIKDSSRGHFCDCPDNCNSRQYQMTLNVRKLNYPKNSTDSLIRAQVYYGQRVMTKIITKLKYTDLDLLANFGGIISLYMGASALSFVEVGVLLAKILWALLKSRYEKCMKRIK
ncbi:pickpocket protein 19 [Drosophila bipectinata]|uniref:pickpocket protein 19 n=1 Tax=Drosophila bipectinata TaxID=42026 RepID=UPI001C8AD47C|nr:pickpocket protein 19 [Drosophila bipectinata]